MIEIHQSFRLELISGCGNRVLQVFAESLLTECLRLLRETGESLPSDYLSDLITGDRRLLDAIKQGSMDEACEALNTVIQLEVAGAADDLRRGEAAAGSMDKKGIEPRVLPRCGPSAGEWLSAGRELLMAHVRRGTLPCAQACVPKFPPLQRGHRSPQ